MSSARHMIALLKSHLEGDDKEFLSVAMQAAAHEARLGHVAVAQQLRDLIDESKRRSSAVGRRSGNWSFLNRAVSSRACCLSRRPRSASATWLCPRLWPSG